MSSNPAARNDARARGVRYLLAQQGADGGWTKSRYGALRGGAALTAMSLYALVCLGPEVQTAARAHIEAAAAFLRRGLARRGCIAAPDGTLDLPVYAASLALLAAREWSGLWSDGERETLAAWLERQQIGVARGFSEPDRQVGGWDLGSEPALRGITTGANTSLTSFALEALHSVRGGGGAWATSAVVRTARAWLARCQRFPGDGGFAFTVDAAEGDEKSSRDAAGRPQSYGTATCDGLVARLSCAETLDDPAAKAALDWLDQHADVATTPGFDDEASAGWREGLWYYYVARRTAVLRRIAPRRSDAQRASDGEWCDEVARLLVARQREDGGWANASPRMREDDPAIAVPLALLALRGLD
ncbi:MAG: prenyltransferase/squalene oxidase repeat-containing protein [Pirellulales bacterium]